MPSDHKVDDQKWNFCVEQGIVGLTYALWAPDSSHVVLISELGISANILSLTDGTSMLLRSLKDASPAHALEFSHDGRYLAYAGRKQGKDSLHILDATCWETVSHFQCKTRDLAGIKWSPSGDRICAWENPVHFEIVIHSIDGRHLASYSESSLALGIRMVTWSHCGTLLALGCYNQKLKLLNHLTWKPLVTFEHTAAIYSSDVTIYYEHDSDLNDDYNVSSAAPRTLANGKSGEIMSERPFHVPNKKPDLKQLEPEFGIRVASFDRTSRYLATINDNMPKVLWIWSLAKVSLLAVLVQRMDIKYLCLAVDSTYFSVWCF